MGEQLIAFFLAFFANLSILGIGLAVVFGAVWLAGYWPPLFKKPWLWAVLAGSAILTLIAITFIQIPLQSLIGQALTHFWSQEVLFKWLLIAGIPGVLLSGLIQEGAKLVPTFVYWWRSGKKLSPKMGLIVGAVAGAGFGIFEAQWVHNSIFASGWSLAAFQIDGVASLIGFWERFYAIAFHTGASALAGYGLAKGKWWQFYLLISLLHALLNYGVVLFQSQTITLAQMEIFIAVLAIAVSGVALWLRWRPATD